MTEPIHIHAVLGGAVSISEHPIALDSLLAAAACARDGVDPALVASEISQVEIPIEREPNGRFHLCSSGEFQVEEMELRYINKRAPIEEYSTLGTKKIGTVNITAGVNKSYRIPMETAHLVDSRIDWWALGDFREALSLLGLITHLGRRRAVGCGRVKSWKARVLDRGDLWEGFPVVRDGMPLRNLPLDWPGVDADVAPVRYGCLTYPYWTRHLEEPCYAPR